MANETEIVGATIAGKYRVRRIVGSGSMGVVCEAEHLEIGKRVAIKLIDVSLAGMADISMRFRQEARATSLVESHHIVQVFDVGTDDRLGLYLVMEYLAGEDLAKVLAREKQLPVDTAVRVAVQVARGLAKAHEAGVVHRDLKPANIFLCTSEDEQPIVKILDFGISKVLDSSRGGSGPGLKLTRDGMVLGTPQYMSPEQAQGFSVDERSDVWALGLVLYEMLAGRPAYGELPSYEQFIIHLVSNPPDPLARVAPWVPDEIASVVHRALEHDVTARIQTCAELVRLLTEAHPIHSGRVPRPTISETTDTWSDPRSFESGPGRRRASPGVDSNGAQAEKDVQGVWRDRGAASSSGLSAEAGSLASSGVRGPTAQSHPPEDFQEDAPQFFDRKLLQTFDPTPSGLPHASTALGASATTPAPDPPPASREVGHRAKLLWAGVSLFVLAVAILTALIWR